MKVILANGTKEELADFVYLLDCPRVLERKPYSDKYEVKPENDAFRTADTNAKQS